MASIVLPTTAVPGAGARSKTGRAGATLLQGQIVYFNTSRKFALARANALGTSVALGMVQQGATTDAPVSVQTEGTITGLTGLTVGKIYVLSDSVAGSIMPIEDMTAGKYLTIIGYANTTTSLVLLVKASSLVTA